MTNGDRLRNMNDDELAYLFQTNFVPILETICEETDEEECIQHYHCKDCTTAWIKKEYKPQD